MTPWILWRALYNTAGAWNVVQILLFLPLTLSTLSRTAFLLLSLLLTVQSFIHCTLLLIWGSAALPFLQIPTQPFLLLACFNLFSAKGPHPALMTAATWWGQILSWSSLAFVVFEGMASLIVVQSLGQRGKRLVERSEESQIALLVAAAAAYVCAAWWVVVAYPWTATTPLSSTLLGVALTALVFLTFIGFAVRRTNVIEAAGMALFVAYNVWLCSDVGEQRAEPWYQFTSSYGPLLGNLLPHFQKLLSFIMHTIPKPLLIALLYRLTILHLASRIIPSIGADSWEGEYGVDGNWDGRPTSKLTHIILTYRQTILVTVYSHLLLLDRSSQIWWRWTNIFFTLTLWALEIVVSSDDESGLGESKWKVD